MLTFFSIFLFTKISLEIRRPELFFSFATKDGSVKFAPSLESSKNGKTGAFFSSFGVKILTRARDKTL